ncbi:MAG: hypothetical protein LH615_13820 [Ferruginibacter sp.]|nr:hypothetical protein [Ferruginibacter sp.]
MEIEDKERLLKYLYDALSAAESISMDMEGLSVTNYHFNNIRWIAERGIEIISEALKRASFCLMICQLVIFQKYLQQEIK